MPFTILPEIVRCNLRPIRHALDEYEAHDVTPEQADELSFVCSFLADSIERSWARIQGLPRQGIEGRKLLSILQELSTQTEEALQTFQRLPTMVRSIPNYRAAEGELSRLPADVERVEQVRKQVATQLVWLNAPPPPIDVERLKSLEAGPFVSLVDLQARGG